MNGIECGTDFVTIARYIPSDNTVSNVIIKHIDGHFPDFWEGLKPVFKSLIAEIRFAGQDVICCLPGENSFVKKALADSDEADVEEVLRWDMAQHLVGNIDEYAFDYQPVAVAGKTRKPESEYLTVAYRAAAVSGLSSLMKTSRLNLLAVDLDIFALANVFEVNYREKIPMPAALLLAGANRSKLVLVHNGGYVDFDSFEHGSPLQSPGDYTAALRSHYETFCAINESYARQEGFGLYCAGSAFTNAALIDAVAGAVPNTQIVNPFRKIGCSAEMSENDIRKFAPQLAVAVGCAVHGR